MIFKKEDNPEKINEFLNLVENPKVELRHYKKPVLVWAVDEGTVFYSFWEEEMLSRYGLDNVDGWDFEEDLLFCPDWIGEAEEEDLDDFDLNDEDIEDLSNFLHHKLNDKD